MEAGNFYHVFNRGINSEKIFKEERNYSFFLKRFDQYVAPFVDVYAYCLMPTHFHFLVCVKDGADHVDVKKTSDVYGLSQSGIGKAKTSDVYTRLNIERQPANRQLTKIESAFKNFFNSYAKSINASYHRHGSLFQHKFKRKPVETQQYLLNVISYIHFNPVKDGLVKRYSEWQYSSFNSIVNNQVGIVNRKEVIDIFTDLDEFISFHSLRQNLNPQELNKSDKEIENFF
jgi:putative transposase